VWTYGRQVNIEGAISRNAIGEVYNLLGIKVFKTNLGEETYNTFTVSPALKGVHIVKISDGNKTTTQKVNF